MERAGNWRAEADAVIKDVDKHVRSIKLSSKLECDERHIYLNLTTVENEHFCVELSGNGFRIVGKAHDLQDQSSEEYYETPYSLLSKISPMYNDSFGRELMDKLNKLYDKQKS